MLKRLRDALLGSDAKSRAREHFAAGWDAAERGDEEGSVASYLEAVRHDPALGIAWFNLGLAAKRRRDWPMVADRFRKAIEAGGLDDVVPAWWNLGIASCALGDWASARESWAHVGVNPEPGDGPPDMRLGLAPVRVDPAGHAEVVWTERLDPARARIVSVPLPQCGRRHGDVVLHDGEPRGSRTVGTRSYAVFDELERLHASSHATWRCAIVAPDADAVTRLTEDAADAGLGAEDWTTLRHLCATCSERDLPSGRAASEWTAERTLGIASPGREQADELLDAWCLADPRRERAALEQVG